MNLQEFINLPSKNTISFQDSQGLHSDIALNGIAIVSTGKVNYLLGYLEICLLHRSVVPDLINKLELTVIELRSIGDKLNALRP